jgi:5-formyltetrahydrofolate cyclo-ligase
VRLALMDKGALRRAVRERVAALSLAERAAQSAAVEAAVRALLPADGLVAAYVARADEIDLGPLLGELAAAGRLVLPRVEADELALLRVVGLDGLRAGQLGVQEPADGERVAPEALAAMIVPGRAFDLAGGRLGRGKGHYDRLLGRVGGLTVGVGFDAQEVAQVPQDPWDVHVGRVVFGRPQGSTSKS